MTNEFIYKLNLPHDMISKMILNYDEIKKEAIRLETEEGVPLPIMPNGIDSIYHKWMGIEWTYIGCWYKADGFAPNVAHDDCVDPKIPYPWSINFHIGGSGLYEIWKMEDVIPEGPVIYDKAQDYLINGPTYKSYYMPEGVYLNFNSMPHRVRGFGKRFCFSWRCEALWNVPHEEILDRFKDYLDPVPLLNEVPEDVWQRVKESNL